MDYINNNCNTNKKIFVLLTYDDEYKKDSNIQFDDIIGKLKDLNSFNLDILFVNINISEDKVISDKLMDVLLYCSKNPIRDKEEEERMKEKNLYQNRGSCVIL